MAKNNYYVVFEGIETGIFDNWSQCEAAVKGYPGAKYKGYTTKKEANMAYKETLTNAPSLMDAALQGVGYIQRSICVDGACQTLNKRFDFQGVWLTDHSIAFNFGPFYGGTNNIAEFLAIVAALKLLKNQGLDWPVYSDSQTALTWVHQKSIKSKALKSLSPNHDVVKMVDDAVGWLRSNDCRNQLLKWHTRAWGEIPADYGHK